VIRARLAGVAELALVLLIALGCDLFRIIPLSDVPWLFVIGWISLRLRGQRWRSVGLVRPASWRKTVAVAAAAAIALQLLSTFVTEPIISRLTHQPTDLSLFRPLVGNVKLLLLGLGWIWTLAAIGEELVYRGYLLNRIVDLIGRTPIAWACSVLLVSALFGLGHLYQGPTGALDTAVTSLLLAALYLGCGRNLWLPILTHGMTDTIALLLIFFNQVSGVGSP